MGWKCTGTKFYFKTFSNFFFTFSGKCPPTQNDFNITKFKILFDILNINITTNLREVNVAYRMIARKNHPDKYNELCEFTEEEGIEIFQNNSNAYEDLK